FDLNNLKHINDAYGHPAGDDAIQSFARLLEETFPAPSLVGRVGGDEFSVITKKTDFAALRRKVSPIIEGFQLKVGPDAAGTTTVACSVGAASTCFAGADLNLLVNQADEAMYFAKKRVSGLEFYDSNMRARSNRRLELSSQLRRDVANDRIKAVFQPIFDLSTSKIVAFEALARWKTPRLGEVGPDEFLPVAQDAGIICELDSVVRRQAFELCRDLRDRGSQIPVSVNVTAPDLARTDFLERFVEDLGASGLSGSDVIVEVTERIFDDRGGHTIDTLSALARLGVSVQLDDFGKGFSSHGLLPLFSFDAAKIDMHFAGDPVKDTKAAAIVISLLNLAREIGLKVVLEGIETQDQRDFATQQLPDRVQGFLMGRPVDKAKVIELVQSPGLMVAAE
ncbi:MAG: bifunctional diguanylate cyclase/phosphodiesterase, partial [Pseudomonadota bacterium]